MSLEDQLRNAVQAALEAGWTIRKLAQACAVQHPLFSKWLRGQCHLSIETADKLVELFQMQLTSPTIPPAPLDRRYKLSRAGQAETLSPPAQSQSPASRAKGNPAKPAISWQTKTTPSKSTSAKTPAKSNPGKPRTRANGTPTKAISRSASPPRS